MNALHFIFDLMMKQYENQKIREMDEVEGKVKDEEMNFNC